MRARAVRLWRPLNVEVVWDDPKSTHDTYTIADVLMGKGCGLQRGRRTTGYLGYINAEYLELYSDFDEADGELGGGTAILIALVTRIRLASGKVIYSRD